MGYFFLLFATVLTLGLPSSSTPRNNGDQTFPLVTPIHAAAALNPVDSCRLNPPSQGLRRIFNACAPTSNGGNLLWSYSSANQRLSAVYICKPAAPFGWCAWGISPNGRMLGSNAIVAYTDPLDHSRVNASVFHLSGYTSPEVVRGNYLAVEQLGVDVSSDGMTFILNFTLTLPESQFTGYQVWAQGPGVVDFQNGELMPHADPTEDGGGAVDFVAGTSSSNGPAHMTLKQMHATLAVAGFGILMPVGILLARHVKVVLDPFWFYAHIAVQLTGYILGATGFVFGIILKEWSNDVKWKHFDFAVGIIVMSSLQMVTPFVKPGKKAPLRTYWNIVHYALGYGTVLLAMLNNFEGFEIMKGIHGFDVGHFAYKAFLVIWGCAFLLLEAGTWIIFFRKSHEEVDIEKPLIS